MPYNVENAKKMIAAMQPVRLKTLRALLDAGFNLDHTLRPDDHYTALHFAAAAGEQDACRLFLDRGADVNVRCRTGLTPLHFAANRAYPDVCSLLIDAGADVHMRCYKNESTVHWAAAAGSTESCEVLVKAGAQVNVEDRLGQTPLHFATRPETFEYLVSVGADPMYAPRKTTKDYLTPFQYVVCRALAAQARLCLSRGGIDLAQKTLDGRTLMDLGGHRRAIRDLLLEAEDMQAQGKLVPAVAERKKRRRALAPH